MAQTHVLRYPENARQPETSFRNPRDRPSGIRIIAFVKPVEKPVSAEEKKRLDHGLIEVSGMGFVERIKEALQHGADVNAKDCYGRTALMKAAFGNRPEAVEFLLDNGANVNAASSEGWTALMYATYSRNTEIVESLLLRGADATACDNDGKTALDITFREVAQRHEEKLREMRAILQRYGESAYLI